jgi:ATP-dependent DNA helicase RecG
MNDFLEKWIRLFSHEIKSGYQNKAVIGGLEKVIPQWQSEATKNNILEVEIDLVVELIRSYQSTSFEKRKASIGSIISLLESKLDIVLSNEDKINLMSHSHQEDEEYLKGLNAPVTSIQRIGEHTARNLARLGIYTIKDLLHHYPKYYRDLSSLKTINHLSYGEEVSLIGTIYNINLRYSSNRRIKLVEALVSDGTGYLHVTWFNQPWLEKSLPKGRQIILSGKVDKFIGKITMINPDVENLDQEQLHTNRIVPVYPLTSGITQKNLRRIIFETVKYWTPKIHDYLEPSFRSEENFLELSQALANIHFPQTNEKMKDAIRRLSFDEVLFMQLGVLTQKNKWENNQAEVFSISENELTDAIQRLPFKLTKAQEMVVAEIVNDLQSGKPMNRLIQGDVGSGKTVIAALAMIILLKKDAQTAFLAPTSLLAEQHFHTLTEIISDATKNESVKLEIGLLIGDTPENEKKEIRRKMASGELKIIIGTHALLENPINFNWLQLVVIDEQHRFGVEQRAQLRNKGNYPHLLVMTATPIPRSLALTIYGDLDVSIIDEMPVGRLPVETHVLLPMQRDQAYSLISKEVQIGHQAFIVYPMIENDDEQLYKSAVDEFHRIQKNIFPYFKIGLMHGRLKQIEKDKIMRQFRDNKLDILISTTVIEVGMDIPNATIVLIEGANRFGLAQLHQIRGRVGRSSMQSYCLLIPENESGADNERLAAMVETNDGFKLAEYDLKQRGPGDFLGTRQSGYTGLKLASLTDTDLIVTARNAAIRIFHEDPNLSAPNNHLLYKELQSYWPNLSGDIS